MPSEEIRGDQRRSEEIRGDQRRSEEIRGDQRRSEEIRDVIRDAGAAGIRIGIRIAYAGATEE